MIAAEFLDQVQKLRIADYAGFEDFADKFNFLVTVLVIMMCTMVVTVKQYMLKPISCYMATDIGGRNLLDYVENYCWVQGTIPISFSDNIPDTEAKWLELNEKKILYYQWVPFVLGLQCILFYLPRIFWQMICQNKSGTDMQHIITMANEAVNSPDRKGKIKQIANILARMLNHACIVNENRRRKLKRVCCNRLSFVFVNKRAGSFLFGMYMVIKVLYLANAIGQIFLLESFLGYHRIANSSGVFGYQVAQNIARGSDSEIFPIFPRIGYCLTKIRQTGGSNFVAAQCVLPVNMLNERIYVFLWFWFCINASLTLISIPIWLINMFAEKAQLSLVRDYLKYQEVDTSQDDALMNKFVKTFLRNDGVFIIRMIASNSNTHICGEIVKQMWEDYSNDPGRVPKSNIGYSKDAEKPNGDKVDKDSEVNKDSEVKPIMSNYTNEIDNSYPMKPQLSPKGI